MLGSSSALLLAGDAGETRFRFWKGFKRRAVALFPALTMAPRHAHCRQLLFAAVDDASVDPVDLLHLPDIGDKGIHIGLRKPVLRGHIAECPVMRAHPVLYGHVKGHVAVMRGFVDLVDEWRPAARLPGRVRAMALCADGVERLLAHPR